MRHSGAVWLGLAATLLLATGCPSNMCFLTVNGRCTWSSCPDGAEYDTGQRRCVCQPGRFALGGACLTPEGANRYCGKGSHFENTGCTPNRCPCRPTCAPWPSS